MKVKLLKKLRKETFKKYHIDYIKGTFRIWFRIDINNVYTLGKYRTFKDALDSYKHLWHLIADSYIQEQERERKLEYPW